VATAVAGAIIGINSFDQPNVQESKDNTKHFLEVYKKNGSLPDQELGSEGRGLKLTVMPRRSPSLAPECRLKASLRRTSAARTRATTSRCSTTSWRRPNTKDLIQAIRTHLRDALHVATTTGYGPRFLHSTGTAP